jgi:ketosteroid isomerase-like protein
MSTAIAIAVGAALALVAVWLRARLWAFAAQRPEDYAATAPAIDIREALNGPLACEGVIFGPTGRVTSRFTADFHAEWDGDTGRMREHFRYDSGATQDREWTLTLSSDGRIRATAPDVVGAGEGRQEGAAVRLRYRIRLPADAGGHVLDTVDWMYLVGDGRIVNRSQFRKFGIKVAELVATMRKVEAA